MVVGGELRRLREACDISRGDAGYHIRASDTKISRMELGRTGFKTRDVADLLTLYGVTGAAERDTLLALAEQANRPGWWSAYGDAVPSWFEPYLGLEQAASLIRSWEVQFVPGLLQTEDYARAVAGLGRGLSEEDVERRVEVRMRRQEILTRRRPVRLWAVLDEAALRRPVGGREVMRAQIAHLIDMAALPNVTIQLMPFSHGGHAAAGGPITILRMAEDLLPDVVYLEQLNSAIYPDKPSDIVLYWDVMNRLSIEAEPVDASLRSLRRILGEV
ncbi:helix-turn-helix transcriptional regulator [Sphaerisporangium sp. B11E5]|uniref:helix-turn-helix domain-containing protein n=1 Tax=Sphaerisporangium sp. B11E5 TaxID=3153563 RepID=UPI00325E8414